MLLVVLQNVRIDVVFPREYFEVGVSSLNGSYHQVKAVRRGQTLIEGFLKSVVDQVCLCVCVCSISIVCVFVPVLSLFTSRSILIGSLYFRREPSTRFRSRFVTSRTWRSTTPSF